MSFDISIVRPACDHCHRDSEEVWSVNLTHNVNSIVDRCLVAGGATKAKEPGHGYEERSWGRLYGWTTDEVAPILARAIAAASDSERRAELKALEPENGWGTLHSAIRVLGELYTACDANPGMTIRASG